MSTQAQSVENVQHCFDQFQNLVESLSAEQLEVQSLCPAWNLRGVILHVVGVEHALRDWHPQSEDEAPPFKLVGPFSEEHGGDGPEQLGELTRRVFDRRRDNLAALASDDLDRRCMTPVGPATYGQFLDVRTFDIWVHHRDITTPLGIATDDSGPTAEATLDQIHNSLGYVVGKKIGLPEPMTIEFNITGPVTRTMRVAVDGRAKVVSELSEPPTVTVAADSLTFSQLACGRIDPENAIADGRISWSGNTEWGGRAAHNLAFTI